MPRDLWAKIAVETRDDPKLICRPEWERLFWINLILLAKEKTSDGILRGYTPAMLRTYCAVKASAKAVVTALEYFQTTGMLEATSGALTLVNYIKRQGEYDINAERDKWRERKQRQRDRSRDSHAGQAGSHDVTGPDVTPLEENRTEQKRSPLSPPTGGATRLRRLSREKPQPPPLQCAGCRENGHTLRDCPRKAEFA